MSCVQASFISDCLHEHAKGYGFTEGQAPKLDFATLKEVRVHVHVARVQYLTRSLVYLSQGRDAYVKRLNGMLFSGGHTWHHLSHLPFPYALLYGIHRNIRAELGRGQGGRDSWARALCGKESCAVGGGCDWNGL